MTSDPGWWAGGVPGETIGPVLAAAAAVSAVALAVRRFDPALVRRLPSSRANPAERRGRRFVRWLGGRPILSRGSRRERVAARLTASGSGLEVETYVGGKAIGAVAVTAVALLGPAPLPLLAPVAGGVAFVAPDFVVARAARRRRRVLESQLPHLLDLLAAGSTAGLSALLALRRASTAVRDPLAGELRAVLARVELGARWREELRAMAERLDLPELRRPVMAMARTESLGSPLAESLRQRADEVRESRRARSSELARKAPVKMLFPLVFMVLPAFLLLTVVPVLLSTLRSVR
jgi:tight adherence protein C